MLLEGLGQCWRDVTQGRGEGTHPASPGDTKLGAQSCSASCWALCKEKNKIEEREESCSLSFLGAGVLWRRIFAIPKGRWRCPASVRAAGLRSLHPGTKGGAQRGTAAPFHGDWHFWVNPTRAASRCEG